MRKGFCLLMVVLLAIVCLVGCSQNVSQKMGTLVIEIDSAISRGIQAASMETDSYNVTVKNAAGETIFTTAKSPKTSFTISVPTGTCIVEVDALNKAGDVIGNGTVSGQVKANQTTTFNVTVREAQGNGLFNISITGPSGHELAYTVISADTTIERTGILAYANGKYAASLELPNGFYSFTVEWPETNKTVVIDTLRVIKGKTAVYDAEFLFLVDGSISVVNEIIGTPSIKLTGSSRAISQSKTLKVDAEVTGLNGYSCFWVVDDKPVDAGANTNTLELAMAGYEEGEHTVKYFISTNSVIWSESLSFAVLPDRPTTLDVTGPIELRFAGDVLIPYSLTATCFASGGNSYTLSASNNTRRSWNISGTQTLSCELNNPDFIYYFETDYDSARGVNIVYVVIDKYIEDPANLTLDFHLNEEELMDSSFGIFLTSLNRPIDTLNNNNGRNTWGLVPYNPSRPAHIKVVADTYSINANWLSPNEWFYITERDTSFTVSAGEVKTVTLTQGEVAEVKLLIADDYPDGYPFYLLSKNWGGLQSGYAIADGGITVKTQPGYEYEYLFFPERAKEYYYTASVQKSSPGSYTVEAVKHSSQYINTGLNLTSGSYYISVDYDCLIPEDMYIQFRIGERYYSLYDVVSLIGSSRSMSFVSGTLDIWASCSDEYLITARLEEGNKIVISISAAYENYATLNIINDFDFEIPSSGGSAITLNNSTTGITYVLPVINKTKTTIKAESGYYDYWNWYNWIQTDSGRARPNISPTSFRCTAGETTDVAIRMTFLN